MRDRVRQLLEDHRPHDPTEDAHLRQMLDLLGAEADPFARDHFEPGHFTASALVLTPDEDGLLLVLHSKLGRWLQPGGHFEPTDADPLAAARREVLEETGLDDLEVLDSGLLDVDVHAIPAHGSEPAHHHHDLRLLFRAPHCAVAAGDGVDAARFVLLDEIERITADASVLRAVAKLRDRRPHARRAEA